MAPQVQMMPVVQPMVIQMPAMVQQNNNGRSQFSNSNNENKKKSGPDMLEGWELPATHKPKDVDEVLSKLKHGNKKITGKNIARFLKYIENQASAQKFVSESKNYVHGMTFEDLMKMVDDCNFMDIKVVIAKSYAPLVRPKMDGAQTDKIIGLMLFKAQKRDLKNYFTHQYK